MKIGEKVFVIRDKIYGEQKHRYKEGEICRIYTHHILVEFKYANGNSYRESFFKYELIEKEDLSKNAYIY